MGYSTSRAVLESRRDQLQELELGRACRWRTNPNRTLTHRMAYKLREALYIASLYPSEYPALAQAHRGFSIVIVEPGLIEARARGDETTSAPHLESGPPVHGIQGIGTPVPSVGLTTAAEIVDSWQRHLPSLDAINFQQTRLPEPELRELYSWATKSTPRLMLLVGDGFLTVSLRDPLMDEYAWQPPAPPAAPEPTYNL